MQAERQKRAGSRGHGKKNTHSGRADILILLTSEDVDTGDVHLSVTVLTGLGGGHIDNLAREALEKNETVLTQGRSLHREGEGSTGSGLVELLVRHLIRWLDVSATDEVFVASAQTDNRKLRGYGSQLK